MYLADYHTHTRCSIDSQAALTDQAAQAAALGLRELCTTDHCDLIQEQGGRLSTLDWTPILQQYQGARAQWEGILTLRLGLELGCAHVDPDQARQILAGAPLDFVIGSIHNQSPEQGGIDFYFLKYETQQDCYRALDDYFSSMEQLVRLEDCYDVLGHIIYPLRYMEKAEGGPVTLDRYQEQLRAILTAAADAGRGIEVNTYRGRTIREWRPILELYRDCGGEIVTIGSDAHTAQDIGKGVPEAQELLREVGFRYQAIYHRHNAQFVKL